VGRWQGITLTRTLFSSTCTVFTRKHREASHFKVRNSSGRAELWTSGQGFTLVHHSAQPEPFVTVKCTETTQRVPLKSAHVELRSAQVKVPSRRHGGGGGRDLPFRSSTVSSSSFVPLRDHVRKILRLSILVPQSTGNFAILYTFWMF